MNRHFLVLVMTAFSFTTFGQSINIYSLNDGQMQAKGVGFSGPSRAYQVKFFKNNKHFSTMGTSLMGSFDYKSPRGQFKNGDTLSVKVLNYRKVGQHFSRSGVYRDSTGRKVMPRSKSLLIGY